jgi:pimeloyl-ACP methyl ester carboxylesterase
MRQSIGKRAGMLAILVMALVGLTTSAPTWAETAMALDEVGTLNGVTYKIKVPENWNRTLLMYAHGYSRSDPPTLVPFEIEILSGSVLEDRLLAQGYALAASSYRNAGWAVKEGMKDTKALTKFFKKRVAKPDRTILWGSSMGSAVTLKSIEKEAGLYDGAIVFSHLGAGTSLNFDQALSIALAYEVALGWPASWGSVGDVRDDLDFETEVLPDILSKLLIFDPVTRAPTSLNMANFGKFEFLRLVNGIPLVGFYSEAIPLDFWLVGDMLFATAGRGELEARAGGAVSQNLNHTYTLTSIEKNHLAGLGVDADDLLVQMNARTNIEADRHARKYLKKYADFSGKLKRPVLTVQPIGDGMTTPANSHVYQKTVKRAGKSKFLVQTYTNGEMHVGFTPDQVLEAFAAMEFWLDTGERPGPDFFPDELNFDDDYEPPPWPQPTSK